MAPNRAALVRVSRALGELRGELVFVGGQVAELLITDPAATRVRPTDDVDVICEVTGRSEYAHLSDQLRSLGFMEDRTQGAPICRWRLGTDILDVMPADGSILQFENSWYGLGIRTASQYEIAADLYIRVVSAPAFLATKWEAFTDRGQSDWYGSHDLEDIVAVVAGRGEIVNEVADTEPSARQYIASEAQALINSKVSQDVIAGALPDAIQIPGIIVEVERRFESLANLSELHGSSE